MPEPRVSVRIKVGRFAGQVLQQPKSVAENNVATGHAEYVDDESAPSTETATPPPGETPEAPQAAVLSIKFASSPAAEFADKHDLTDADFEGIKPSGKTGYTKADAEAAAQRRE